MPRITLSIPDTLLAKLRHQATEQEISLAQHVRSLVEFGVDQVASTAHTATPANTRELWKNSLAWNLESRYLLRYLVDHLLQDNTDKHALALNFAKEKAAVKVDELLANAAQH